MMIDVHNDRVALLQLGEYKYTFHITEMEQSYGGRAHREVKLTGMLMDTFRESNRKAYESKNCSIKRVIFNDPATIVYWSDDTKTVVKCQAGDTYDKEKGLALCIAKKFLGNKGNFNDVFKKWIPESVEPIDDKNDDVIRVGSKVEVIRDGLQYPTYRSWVEKNVESEADRRKWGKGKCRDGDVGRVVCIANHGGSYDAGAVVAYVDFGEYCSMIDVEGLKKIV